MHDLVVVVPVLGRPHRVAPLAESLARTTDRARLLLVVDSDDIEELAAVEAAGVDHTVNHDPARRSFACKANDGYRASTEPWLLFCGDDVEFHVGWVENSIDEPHGCSFISTNDLGQPRVMSGIHAVHPIIRRSWIDTHGASWDGPGTVCHEGYRHQYVDDEWTMVAKAAGEYVYAPCARLEHLHPMMGKNTTDATYRIGEVASAADRDLFAARLAAHVA